MNSDLADFLTVTCKVFRPSETRVAGRTRQALSLNSTGVPCEIQARSRREQPDGFGYELEGDHQLFLQSTGPVQRGDLVQPETGPWVGTNFWVRAEETKSDEPGFEYVCWNIELTTESTGDID